VTFEEALLGWHDFYVATAGAAAALLGLLFVGVSINLGALNAPERIDLRERASQAFTNLTFVLVLALSALIPQNDAQSLAVTCGVLVVIGAYRGLRRIATVSRHWDAIPHPVLAIRRQVWSLLAVVLMAFAAYDLWTRGTSRTLYDLIAVNFLLLLGAADVSWDLLVRVSEEEPTPDQGVTEPAASRPPGSSPG
jgi:hypothetical protein